ncbi:MFS transporter [Patescibacteria group bacterium]
MLFLHRKHAHRRAMRVLLGTNALILLAGAMLAPIYALFVEEVGGDLLDASLTGAAFALAAGIAALFAGRIADRVKEAELIVAAGYVIIGACFLALTQVRGIYGLLVVQVVIGLAEATYSPSFDALFSKHLDRRRAGAAWGTWEAMAYFMTAAGALVGGFVASFWGFNALFVLMAALSFASGVYIYFLPRKIL